MRTIKILKSAIEKQLAAPPTDVSIIELVDLFVEYAYSSRASDIHIEPADEKVAVRLRIDGILHDTLNFSKEFQDEVISRIKVLSGLKTDIHHIPQDGRFKAKIEGAGEKEMGEVDIRVSVAPTYYGENSVLRILAEAAQSFALEQLGFNKEQLVILEKAIRKPYGMILCNGPTGSGKTTTLYAFIKKLNTREISIITIEDPIEYSIEGITQMPVAVGAGLTFANGLRSILRQDPNVIMVGEIRDSETANIAVNAALTGHLMLSTLHTNDAATTFPRLIDMGVPPFLVASTLNVALAQRLVRIACPNCRKQRILSIAEIKSFGGIAEKMTSDKVYTVGPGCAECGGTGYKSRIGIHEVLEVDDEIRSLIVGRADATQIKQLAVKRGMAPMIEDGLEKARAGVTTIEEVLRIIYE
ncbi:MAG: Type IV-A pilus assembly ATPase PilB [Candidatus Jorgensenbacteria bacterium GW2011_GWA1_48_13]|uniref:Type IV-A pilus assembly ATPase PilB n=2 Tax=Candidatus Joergenseniibacteriota TaxID=1752739 RepID=A0A0G1Z7Y6_9BACT|nr:MAG: Type IV-A pilus assembly ATPase PilB [Candidatus Jorgensenbacteria bacterium GW2011_GWA1_48_13]KKU99017.1 MAG: Type IV-A pilus assembly ATPase PilB [Candidatus Jorgensenbacteria bacterium GW2011_GWC1_48_8]KKW15094.1 MAG: Type IV-A pilus assembly ATPase PilB [Candidatus Jorgensenbacteria bacterium GW2011_GWB1_50_10]